MLGSSVTFGGLAVDGFFIISGYLIASSFLSSRSLMTFLTSRILRIYPAFIAAYLICVLVAGPIGGGMLEALGVRGWLLTGARMLLLMPPELPGAFHALPVPALNGSMWTIRYEFRCYLLVGLLGVMGLLDRRALILAITAFFYVVAIAIHLAGMPAVAPGLAHQLLFGVIGDPERIFPLGAIFMSGVCFRLYRDRLAFRPLPLMLAALACMVVALTTGFGELAIGLFGTYVLLWLATGLKSRWLEQINNRYDFSYGVYLYAWPVASVAMVLALGRDSVLSPLALTIVTIALSTVAAVLSWYAIERPALALKPRRRLAAAQGAES
jgi:peptidoglycan/LPS O-acetylase OafA/YrhL